MGVLIKNKQQKQHVNLKHSLEFVEFS